MTACVCIRREYRIRYRIANDSIPLPAYSFRVDTLDQLGDRIRTARKLRGWSQEDLGARVSELIGRSPPYGKAAVQKWESGATEMPPGDVVWALAELFAIPHALLLWGPDKRPPSERKRPASLRPNAKPRHSDS
jgi:transcriptional regulator with XRE-family HTH domain